MILNSTHYVAIARDIRWFQGTKTGHQQPRDNKSIFSSFLAIPCTFCHFVLDWAQIPDSPAQNRTPGNTSYSKHYNDGKPSKQTPLWVLLLLCRACGLSLSYLHVAQHTHKVLVSFPISLHFCINILAVCSTDCSVWLKYSLVAIMRNIDYLVNKMSRSRF